ncbi:MAG: PEP-CTERM sorting domain-containing protein, partial [Burkholderiales bacterium]|nr:PEP-CTERM sorting domain-containing protein [Burkholderiales bacterium]
LEVGAGAVLRTGSASLGTSKKLGLGQGTGEGAAWVAGAGAVWINSGHLALGTKGVAQLDVLEGGKLRSGSAALGDGSAVDPSLGRNLARIAGSGSEWKNTGDLWVGGGATGPGRASDLWVSDGALLQVGGTLTVHAGSSLIVDGGAWTAARTAIGGRIDILSNSEVQLAGALSLLTGGRLTSAAPITFRGAVDLASGAHIDTDQLLRFEGAVNLHAGATFGGEGTKVFAGGLSLDGEFVDQSTNALIVLASSNTYIAGLGGAAPDLYGRYVSRGSIRLGGTLVLVPRLGYQAVPGNAFDLFDGALSGSFDRIDVSAFALTPGLNWDFSRLNTEGVVSLTAAPIPEPGTWALWLAGLAGLSATARRRRPAV